MYVLGGGGGVFEGGGGGGGGDEISQFSTFCFHQKFFFIKFSENASIP